MGRSIRYELVTRSRDGNEHVTPDFVSEQQLTAGDLVSLRGTRWIVDRVDDDGSEPHRAVAEPARYRLVLRHEGGSEEAGAFRRFRANGPVLGHAFTTLEDGEPVSWQVTEERLARDEAGAPYVEFVAERDFGEQEDLPNHELEHLAEPDPADLAGSAVTQAQAAGLQAELVALEPGAEPDWDEAGRYIASLTLDELGDDVLELCGVDFARPRDTWAATARERLQEDLERFRADVEGDRDEIEEWDSGGSRILASVGRWEDEAAEHTGHGWMSRLVDASALGAAGFRRVRKVEI
jgi:hypothetical protein